MEGMGMRAVPPHPLRRLVLGLVGGAMCALVLVLGPYAVDVGIGVATDHRACLDGYSCPARVIRVLAGAGFGIVGLGATGLFAASGIALVRYSVTGGWRRWIPLVAVAAPALAIMWFAAFLLYAGSLGAFS